MEEQQEEKTNHIEEYFASTETQKGNEIFRIDDKNSDIKSEVNDEELKLINTLKSNDEFLKKFGIKPIYANYYKNFLRLKVSFERKGRSEYVEINKTDNSGDLLNKFGNMGNMLNVKQ